MPLMEVSAKSATLVFNIMYQSPILGRYMLSRIPVMLTVLASGSSGSVLSGTVGSGSVGSGSAGSVDSVPSAWV